MNKIIDLIRFKDGQRAMGVLNTNAIPRAPFRLIHLTSKGQLAWGKSIFINREYGFTITPMLAEGALKILKRLKPLRRSRYWKPQFHVAITHDRPEGAEHVGELVIYGNAAGIGYTPTMLKHLLECEHCRTLVRNFLTHAAEAFDTVLAIQRKQMAAGGN
jgi:hypothetical protein